MSIYIPFRLFSSFAEINENRYSMSINERMTERNEDIDGLNWIINKMARKQGLCRNRETRKFGWASDRWRLWTGVGGSPWAMESRSAKLSFAQKEPASQGQLWKRNSTWSRHVRRWTHFLIKTKGAKKWFTFPKVFPPPSRVLFGCRWKRRRKRLHCILGERAARQACESKVLASASCQPSKYIILDSKFYNLKMKHERNETLRWKYDLRKLLYDSLFLAKLRFARIS